MDLKGYESKSCVTVFEEILKIGKIILKGSIFEHTHLLISKLDMKLQQSRKCYRLYTLINRKKKSFQVDKNVYSQLILTNISK